jgi:hypothetical protein
MSSRNKILITIFSLLLIGLIISKPIFKNFRNSDTIANKIGCRIFELNSINVQVDKVLDLDKVVVKNNLTTVFEDGNQKNSISQVYGHTILKVYYNQKLISEIGHFKSNSWQTNDYEIAIKSIVNVKFNIKGPDSKNDSFQKRYIRNNSNELIRTENLTADGIIYNVSENQNGTK